MRWVDVLTSVCVWPTFFPFNTEERSLNESLHDFFLAACELGDTKEASVIDLKDWEIRSNQLFI